MSCQSKGGEKNTCSDCNPYRVLEENLDFNLKKVNMRIITGLHLVELDKKK